MYHYVATAAFPYTLGCFRGTPGRIVTASAPLGVDPGGARSGAASRGEAPTPVGPRHPDAASAAGHHARRRLVPAYDREIADYTVRCTGGSVTLSVRDAPSGTVVAVDDGPASGLDRAATVPLVAGQRFDWTVTDALRTTTHHARCLPDDFPLWDTERSGAPQAEWYVFTPSLAFGPNDPGLSRYVSVVDARGVPVWWQNETRGLPLDGQILGGAEITWTIAGTSFALYGSYDIRGWDGRVTSTIGGTLDHHDLVRTERGTYLALSYVVRPCATDPGECIDVTGYDPGVPAADTAVAIVDGEVHEYSAAGTLIWSWSTRDHVDLAEAARWYTSGIRQDGGGGPAWYDVVHLNSVEDDGDGVLISARHTDAVYRVLKATGEIDWKLGGTTTPRSLTVIGDTATGGLFGGQHDARRLPDGTVTVHDNGTGLNRAPRALRLSIDPGSRSATVIESVTDPRAPASLCCGSSRRLPGGNWVSAWGANPFVTEQAPDGSAVLTMRFAGSAFSYRIAPTLPGVVAAPDLRAGMDAMHPRNPGG